METWNYTSPEATEVAKVTFRNYVRSKVIQLNGGCSLNHDGLDLVFIGLDGATKVRFSKSKEGSHVAVTFPSALKEKTSLIVAGLMAQKKLKAINKPADEIPKAKPFIPAFEVLKKYLAMDSFIQHIEVLPACLAHVTECRYEHDGKLDRALKNLTFFAIARAGKKLNHLALTTLAERAGLSSLYRPEVSDTAVRLHADYYHFAYQGQQVLFAEHVTLGSGSPRECMSIHFHWDELRSKLIIGYFGAHLPTAEDK